MNSIATSNKQYAINGTAAEMLAAETEFLRG
jgi:hypothetical protein